MKRNLLITFSLLIYYNSIPAQNPLVKKWDKMFGGTDQDEIGALQQTIDGGYILGGTSFSNIGGDKSQLSWGQTDFWIIKIDSLGNKEWDRRFGGNKIDRLEFLKQTTDKGYVLGGYSNSDVSGDKTQPSWDITGLTYDCWIIKIDSLGNKQWDARFGGTNTDYPKAIDQTADGGYIIGASSYSDNSGDKSQPSWGDADYWIIKTDSLGNKQWDKRYGGTGGEDLFSLKATAAGGYLLGGLSTSGINGDKSQPNWDTMAPFSADYWIIKIDSTGIKQWDKRYGGGSSDALHSLIQTSDLGYILSGSSYSGISGDKTEANRDSVAPLTADYWIIKIDSIGNKIWDKDFGGNDLEALSNTVKTFDGGYLIAGASNSNISGDKTQSNFALSQTWAVKTDSLGNKKWDRTLQVYSHCHETYAIETNDGCYTMVNSSDAGIGGDKTQPAWNNSLDYWIIKFCDTTLTASVSQASNYPFSFSIYPNPADNNLHIELNLKAASFLNIQLYNAMGSLIKNVENSLQTGNYKKEISLENSVPGLYFLKISTAEGFSVAKVIVE